MTFVEAKERALRIAHERREAANAASRLTQVPQPEEKTVDNSSWTGALEAEKDAEALELLARFVP